MKILLLSCYELGHQPLSLAWPHAVLEEAGHTVKTADLAQTTLPRHAAKTAAFIAIAVPMHTALRLGVATAQKIRRLNPTAHLTFYGLYAHLNADYLLAEGLADSVIAGEYEQPLLELANALANDTSLTAVPSLTTPTQAAKPHLARLTFPVPQRSSLPPLGDYARYMHNGTQKVAGYVEASRGCLHTCRHCPVVPIYNGRFFIIPRDTVLADIRQQVAAGAQHITFGDPDFLNGPKHALRLARELHAEFPQLTFDFTTKVEHILQHRDLFSELAACGARFVISAIEAIDDTVLTELHKGHTAADIDAALNILADAGLHMQPTLVAFTPWLSLDGYLDLLTWIRERNLIQHIPAVQLSIRLLIPPNSALLTQPTNHPITKSPNHPTWLGPLDAPNFTYRWAHPDPRMDSLQRCVAHIAEQMADADPYATFARIEQEAYALADRPAPVWSPPDIIPIPPPRLTEDWFC